MGVRENAVAGVLIVLSVCGSIFCTGRASAQQCGPEGARCHDGFFLRMSLGLEAAVLNRSVDAEVGEVAGYEGDSEVRGGALSTELTIGGTPARGLVVAGSLYSGGVYDAKIERDDGSDGELDGALHLSMMAVTLDYYFEETGGFHLGGSLGPVLGWARLPEGSLFEYIGGWGGGIAFNIGYDWWVGRQWSLGILGRFLLAGLSGKGTESGITASEEDGYGSLSLLFTAVYH
jgi:hypothetical protein